MNDTPEVGFVYDDRYLRHNTGIEMFWTARGFVPAPFVEPILHRSNYRLAIRTKHLLDLGGLSSRMVRLEPRAATVDELTETGQFQQAEVDLQTSGKSNARWHEDKKSTVCHVK